MRTVPTMSVWFLNVLVLVVVAGAVLPAPGVDAETPCTSIDTTKATGVCNGVVYDLSQMKNVKDGTKSFQAKSRDGIYNFFFQMADGGLPTSQPGCIFENPPGNAVGQGSLDWVVCYPVGRVAEQSWTISATNPQVISVLFNGGQSGRQTTLKVTCNKDTYGTFTAFGETAPGSLIYEVDMQSCAACAEGCGSSPPPPPPPSPPPPPQSCPVPDARLGWPVARGSRMGLGQSPNSIPGSGARITERTFAYALPQPAAAPVVDADNNVYVVSSVGVIVVFKGEPIAVLRIPGSGNALAVALVDGGSVAAVVAENATGGYLHFYSRSFQLINTIAIPGATGATGGGESSSVGYLTMLDGSEYNSVVGGIGNVAFAAESSGSALLWSCVVDSPISRVVVNSDSDYVLVDTPQSLYSVSREVGLIIWRTDTAAPGLSSLIMYQGKGMASEVRVYTFNRGTGILDQFLPAYCTSPMAVNSACDLICYDSERRGVTAFKAGTWVEKWISGPAPSTVVTDVVVGYNNVVVALFVLESQQVTVVGISDVDGSVLWEIGLDGTGGSLAISASDVPQLFALISNGNSSYLFTIEAGAEGNAAAVLV